jgi:DNA-binding NarL/FixJ family response regulator
VINDDVLRKSRAAELLNYPEINLVGSFASYELAAPHIVALRPSVILLGLSLSSARASARTMASLTHLLPLAKVILLSIHEDEKYVLEGLEAGARGYLLTSMPVEKMVRGIIRVHEGGYSLSHNVAAALAVFVTRRTLLLARLSPTERGIMEAAARGHSRKEIALEFLITMNTLKTHITRILVKTGAYSLVQADFIRRQAV